MQFAKYNISEYPPKDSVIQQIFERYTKECISDEALRRIFEPVGKRILAGEFDRQSRSFSRFFKPLTAPMSAVALFAIAIALTQSLPSHGEIVDIRDTKTPTTSELPNGNTLSGRVISNEQCVYGIGLTLENIEGTEPLITVVTGTDGFYEFKGIPDGTYCLRLTPTTDMDANVWTVTDGKTEFTFCSDGKKTWKGMDIRVCRIRS